MEDSREKAVRDHRRRLKARGLKRVELEASASDATLLRQLAKILRGGDEQASQLRTRLAALAGPGSTDLKALLASAPLEGLRIKRSRDRGRSVDL